jgi:hypothetical protein
MGGEMKGYDEWKTTDPTDCWDGEIEDGCTCGRRLGAGGYRRIDKWCPIHGLDPDEERDKQIERDWD